MSMDPQEFEDRASRAYMRVTGARTKHGWIKWFAAQVRKSYGAVKRWKSGEHPVDPSAIVILERIEADERETRKRGRRRQRA